MHLARLALVTLLCCMTMRDSVCELTKELQTLFFCRPTEHFPHDDGGQMPVPLEGEEGESPLFKLKFEAESWTSVVPLAAAESTSQREHADCAGAFSCSREFFSALHRLRI